MSAAATKFATYLNASRRICQINRVLFSASVTRSLTSSKYLSMAYQIEERGSPNTLEYRMYYKNNGNYISPFHDIPCCATDNPKTYNMVVEVPRWTNSKMEIATKEPLNPIKQDVKKGKLRYVANTYPYKGYIWNYGAIPQTWENPKHVDPDTKQTGDNDPIDVCEIGSRVPKRGDVIQVKILGVLAMIDEGETDWKIIAIDVKDPLADQLNDITDVDTLLPGYLDDTRNWFRVYKRADGKPFNSFAFDGAFKNRSFAERVVEETHKFWNQLMDDQAEGDIDRTNSTRSGKSENISQAECSKIVSANPAAGPAVEITDEKASAWYFLKEEE
ncbi:unnamed protein product [Clavelina lepadiformis]|uniref:inorganic diphosphatase n=1 Tax=Clavelina lepadiformis TaxID=159417 RepID=A0ABP0F9I1_CLALP